MNEREYDLFFKYEFKEKEELIDMIALKNNRIGVLFKTTFNIFDSNTFAKLLTIQENNINYSKVFEIIEEQKEIIILISSEEFHIYRIENKTQKLVQKEELFPDDFIIKISESTFIVVRDFIIYYYEFNEESNKFSIEETYEIEDPVGYSELLYSTYEIKKINYLPGRKTLLLIAEMESRIESAFVPHGHADVALIGIAESSIKIFQHVFIFEYDLEGFYIQKIYEYEAIDIKLGILYKNGEVDVMDDNDF